MLYLFDIDGTILLSGGAGSRALNRVFEQRYGVADGMTGVSPAGKTDPLIVGEMFEARLGRAPRAGEIDELLCVYVPALRDEIAASERFRLMPDVIDALDYLATRTEVVLGLATGNIESAAQVKLERAGLWSRFAFGGYGSDSSDRAQLVARAIERGCEHAGRQLSPREVIVVGDTPRDIHAARANGVRVVAVATGPSSDRDRLAEHAPDALFDTLAELAAWHEAG